MTAESRFELPQWPRFLGTPEISARLRARPEDFQVTELPLITPTGEGSHLWLEVEKRGANTDWVATQLARAAGCAARDVGFAGMKDRHAVTRQWYSLPLPAPGVDDWAAWQIDGVRILQAIPHGRKLKRGALRGNHFLILLRELSADEGQQEQLQQRLQRIRECGLPNYFGAQRFGHGGRNVSAGVRWLQSGGRLPRNKRSLYLSAVRSFLFNHVLARRVEQANWNLLLGGEIAALEGSRSVFVCQLPDEELSQRCRDFDLHPTGPLPGRGGMLPEHRAAELENDVLQPYGDVIEALGKAAVDASRRALRLPVADLQWQFEAGGLQLEFTLPAGAYATTVIDELVSVAD